MIEPLYPLLDKQYELFNGYLDSLLVYTLRVIDRDNMYYSYCYSENMYDIYTVNFQYNGFAGIHLIVYWNGKRMLYQSVSPVLNVNYEPKKSLKNTCLELMDDLEHTVLHLQSWPAAKHHLPLNIKLLRKTIESLKDNT